MTVGNYVRLFLGWLSPSLSGCCGQALCLEARPCPPDPPVPSTQVGPRVLLCWRAPSLPCVRYKILPAWLLGGENGTKLSLHVEIAPNRAISGEQGEFYTGNAVRRGVQGEFCPAHAVRRGVQGEFCPAHAVRGGVRGEFCTEAARRGSCWARFVSSWHLPCVQLPGFRHPPVPHPDPPAPAARSTLVAVGVLHYTKPSGGVSPACRTPV